MDHLLNRKSTPQLPSLPPDDLPGKFATFFTDKIVSIGSGLTIPSEIEKLIKSSPTKSWVSDPLPTSLLKECLQVLLPAITNIVNLSLSSSTMPRQFKDDLLLHLY